MEEFKLNVIISILWLITTVSFLAHGQLHFFESGNVPEEPMALLIFFCLCFLIPMIMAILVLVLKGSFNRWLNIIIASIFLLMNLYHLYGHITEPHQVLIILWMIVDSILIIWFSKSYSKAKINVL